MSATTSSGEEPARDLPTQAALANPKDSSWVRQVLGRLLAHRLLHFLVLGGAAFWFSPSPAENGRTIHISAEEAESVWAMRARHGASKTLAPAEKTAALLQYVEDELYYREGLRLGFDKGDGIVRNRVVQKMMFYAEDVGGVSAPTTNSALHGYFEAHRDRYRREREIKFLHVFVSNTTHPSDGARVAMALRDKLAGDSTLDPRALSEPFAATRLKEWNYPSDLTQDLGEPAALRISELEVGDWNAPIASPYGWHVVRIVERRGGRLATFEEAMRDVLIDYQSDRKRNAMDALYTRLRKEYRLEVTLPSGETFVLPERSSGRTASRGGE